MYDTLNLFADLEDRDVDWILTHGVEQQVIANTTLTREGEVPDALYLVLDGLVGIQLRGFGSGTLGTRGPGQIVGEMSFLEGQPASATVQAVESSLLLVLPRSTLDRKLQDDVAFAARLYRAFARSLSRRLREAGGALGGLVSSWSKIDHVVQEHWVQVEVHLSALKRILSDADRQAIENRDLVPDALASEIRQHFREFCIWLNEHIGDQSPYPLEVRQELGARIQREVLPYILLTKNGERWYSKPRGYAGDFLSIEWVYGDVAEGTGRLGPVLDRCCLDVHAAQAVRNRRVLLVEEIAKTIVASQDGCARVLSMACGPAPRDLRHVREPRRSGTAGRHVPRRRPAGTGIRCRSPGSAQAQAQHPGGEL